MKATNSSASLGVEDKDVSIQNHLLDEIKAKLSSGTKNQDTKDFSIHVKGDLVALARLCASVKTAKETL